MSLPGAPNKTINDLVPYVIEALQDRTDVISIAPKYIMRAIQEITESNTFEELRVTGPTVTLTVGQAVYPVTYFLNSGDDYTSPEVLSLYIDYPTNTVLTTLDYKTPKAMEVMIAPATQGIPSRWTRYGTNLHLGPNPNAQFSVFLRYQRRHPFPPDIKAVGSQTIFLPETWEEIIAYSAALRIAIVKRWTDQVETLHSVLYGDPEFMTTQGKAGRPGILSARIMQNERDQRFNSRQVMMRIPRYNGR